MARESLTVQRVAELERLLGVHHRQRADFIASLDLYNDSDDDDDQRATRFRRLRAALFADLAETPDDGETEWRLSVVDQAIRANTNTNAPEHRLDALETSRAMLLQRAATPLPPPGMPYSISPEEHAQRVASAKRRLGEVDALIEQTRQELAKLYEAA
jgi:hypothetical protein